MNLGPSGPTPSTEEQDQIRQAIGADKISKIDTEGLTAGNMLRVADGGGLEEQTPAQISEVIAASANPVTWREKLTLNTRTPLTKTDRLAPAFAPVTGPLGVQSVVTTQDISVLMPAGNVYQIEEGTPIPLVDFVLSSTDYTPWRAAYLLGGTDWAIHINFDGTLEATRTFTPGPGGVVIGGFHYAMGSNGALYGYGDGPNFTGIFTLSHSVFDFTTPDDPNNVKTKRPSEISITSADPIPAGLWGGFWIFIKSDRSFYIQSVSPTSTEHDFVDEFPLHNSNERVVGLVTVDGGQLGVVPGVSGLDEAPHTFHSFSARGQSINPHSVWDLNWRPSCQDPRGMTCVNGKFWMDIYLTAKDAELSYGGLTSVANAVIADGSNRMIRPSSLGVGLSPHDWWSCSQIAGAYGKSLPSVEELHEAAYGSLAGVWLQTDRISTYYYAALTSVFGLCQSYGQNWVWTRDSGDAIDKRLIWGGHWGNPSAGTRYLFSELATNSFNRHGSRFRADHLIA